MEQGKTIDTIMHVSNSKKRNILLTILLLAIIVVSIVFALFSQNLRITGIAKVNPATLNIKFDDLKNAEITGNAKEIEKPKINELDLTKIENYSVTVTVPGDEISYKFDVVNEGNKNAKIDKIDGLENINWKGQNESTKTKDENIVRENVKYTLTYTEDGRQVLVGDTLNAGDRRQMELKLVFSGDKLPKGEVKLENLGIEVKYVEVEEPTNEPTKTPIIYPIIVNASTEYNMPGTNFAEIVSGYSAVSEYAGDKGNNTYDYNYNTVFNSGSYNADITYYFKNPQQIENLIIACGVYPASKQIYTFYRTKW